MQGIGASTSLARLMGVGLSANTLLIARLPLRDGAFQVDCKLSCLSTLMMCTCFCQGRNTIQVRCEGIYSEPSSCLGEKYRSLGGPQGSALASAFGPTTAGVRGNRPINRIGCPRLLLCCVRRGLAHLVLEREPAFRSLHKGTQGRVVGEDLYFIFFRIKGHVAEP